MKLFLDENISYRVLKYISEDFPNSEAIQKEKFSGSKDSVVWSYAKSKGLTIITHDEDLFQFVTLNGFPPKVIHLFSYNTSAFLMAQFILKNKDKIKKFIQ